MKKNYLLILPILTLVLAGCFHVKEITTSSPSATTSMQESVMTNEKTYNNAEYGFSFKYPAIWSVENQNIAGTALTLAAFEQTSSSIASEGEHLPLFEVHIYGSLQSLNEGGTDVSTLRDYIIKYTTQPVPGYNDPRFSGELKTITIGNKSGYAIASDGNNFGGGNFYLVELASGSILEFWIPNLDEKYEMKVKTVLSSFTFSK